jgi:hypothetical protein
VLCDMSHAGTDAIFSRPDTGEGVGLVVTWMPFTACYMQCLHLAPAANMLLAGRLLWLDVCSLAVRLLCLLKGPAQKLLYVCCWCVRVVCI